MLSLLLDAECGRDLGFAFEHLLKNRVNISFKRKKKLGRKTNFGLTVKGLHCRARMGRVCAAPLLQVSHVIMDNCSNLFCSTQFTQGSPGAHTVLHG